MPNLRELMADYAELRRLHEDESLTPVEVTKILSDLDNAKGQLKAKVDGSIRVLERLATSAAAFKVEEARLAARRKTMENNILSLKNWIRESMIAHDVDKLTTEFHTARLDKGTKKVKVIDETKLPVEYTRRTVSPDKKKILSAYKENGEIVAGCDIITGDPKLVIR